MQENRGCRDYDIRILSPFASPFPLPSNFSIALFVTLCYHKHYIRYVYNCIQTVNPE